VLQVSVHDIVSCHYSGSTMADTRLFCLMIALSMITAATAKPSVNDVEFELRTHEQGNVDPQHDYSKAHDDAELDIGLFC